jgi:hypothetical protein
VVGKQKCLPHSDWDDVEIRDRETRTTRLQDYETTEAVNRESGIQYRTPNAEKLRTENE